MRDFTDIQSNKKTQFDYLCALRRDLREPRQGLVERFRIDRFRRGLVLEPAGRDRKMLPFVSSYATGLIDDHLAHDTAADSQKMRPILPAQAIQPYQPHGGLVHQFGGLQRQHRRVYNAACARPTPAIADRAC